MLEIIKQYFVLNNTTTTNNNNNIIIIIIDTDPETTERAERIRSSRGLEEQTLAWAVSAPNRGD